VQKPVKHYIPARPRHGLEDNIKMDVQEMYCEGVAYIRLAQDWDKFRALLNNEMNFESREKLRIY
jgi:hypothetical protein